MVPRFSIRPGFVRFVLFVMAAFAFVMAILPRPPEILPANPSDKVQHMLAFALLSGLGRLAYPRIRACWIFLWLSAFGALIEVVQAIPALHRDADVHDWLADSIAIAAVLFAASLVRFVRTGRG